MSQQTIKIIPRKVWCPATQQMVTVIGVISPLANTLQELFVKECVLQKDCLKIKHGEYSRGPPHGCLIGERLQASRW
jgi:hypothetical protein